jgi:hypothetical protein
MFITTPSLALPTPAALVGKQAKLWRAVGVSGLHPWLLATFSISGSRQVTETVCMSWDIDLVRRVEAYPSETVVSLLCLIPPSASSCGWISRQVHSVWRGRAFGEEAIVLADADGLEFCADLAGTEPRDVDDRTLVLRTNFCAS